MCDGQEEGGTCSRRTLGGFVDREFKGNSLICRRCIQEQVSIQSSPASLPHGLTTRVALADASVSGRQRRCCTVLLPELR